MKFEKIVNIPLILLSIVLLIVGYVMLGTGPVDSFVSMNIAPVILVFTYVILIPVSFIIKKK